VTAAGSGISGFAADLDPGRADAVLPVVRLLLGLEGPGGPGGVEEDIDNDLAGVAG